MHLNVIITIYEAVKKILRKLVKKELKMDTLDNLFKKCITPSKINKAKCFWLLYYNFV
jgi:hypothetical protein